MTPPLLRNRLEVLRRLEAFCQQRGVRTEASYSTAAPQMRPIHEKSAPPHLLHVSLASLYSTFVQMIFYLAKDIYHHNERYRLLM